MMACNSEQSCIFQKVTPVAATQLLLLLLLSHLATTLPLVLQALLLEVIAKAKLSGSVGPSQQQQVFLRVNCRQGDTTNSAAFAALLAEQLDSADVKVGDANFKSWLEKRHQIKQIQRDKWSIQLQDPKPLMSSLKDVTDFLTDWLKLYPGRPYPVLVIGRFFAWLGCMAACICCAYFNLRMVLKTLLLAVACSCGRGWWSRPLHDLSCSP